MHALTVDLPHQVLVFPSPCTDSSWACTQSQGVTEPMIDNFAVAIYHFSLDITCFFSPSPCRGYSIPRRLVSIKSTCTQEEQQTGP